MTFQYRNWGQRCPPACGGISGSIYVRTTHTLQEFILISMSPKLSNSTPWKREKGKFAQMHEDHRLNFPVIQQFMDTYDYQFKFVVEHRRDVTEILAILKRLKRVDRSRVLMMAQARSKKEMREKAPWIVELCKTHGFGYTPRLQIELYGNRRET